MKAHFSKYRLQFKRPGGTSRGVLHFKDTYFLHLEKNGKKGIGECNLFAGLSAEDTPAYQNYLQQLCDDFQNEVPFVWDNWRTFPSIQMGAEQALLSLENPSQILFPSNFTDGKDYITINGLIWMGDIAFMRSQIKEKLALGFQCLKLKIGTQWEDERALLTQLRNEFSADELELRVDANGAFGVAEAPKILDQLHRLQIHSIEQPIRAGNWQEMAQLCQETPVPIALDEELIGVFDFETKQKLVETILPQYLILKPSLVGGFLGSKEWISVAESFQKKWWVTSALESNIGLNALAQWTYTLQNPLPQGLGTGGLFTNNFQTPLYLEGDKLKYHLRNFFG